MKSKTWTAEQRQVGWVALSSSRRGLKLAISPSIASSYYCLHHFFRLEEHNDYDLYILLISSLFLSCKICDTYRPLKIIYREFAKVCHDLRKHVPLQKIKGIFGDKDFEKGELSIDEALIVGKCELELLKAVNWNMEIDLPFKHFMQHKYVFCKIKSPKPNCLDRICSLIMHDICLTIQNEHYLEFPPLTIAAAAMKHACKSVVMPSEAEYWIQSVEQSDPKLFQIVTMIFEDETYKSCLVSYS